MCTRRMPVDICVKIAIPATRDHLPRGDTLAPNRQCPLVAGTTVHLNLLWSEFVETMRHFDLPLQILVTHVFDLTQIPAEGSGIPTAPHLQS